MFIQTEQTPNPQTLKFLPGKVVMDEGTAFYQNINEAGDSPFARRLFAVDGVQGVFFGSSSNAVVVIEANRNDRKVNINKLRINRSYFLYFWNIML